MRHGCITVQQVQCDGCGRAIKHPERYLLIDEEEAGTKAKEEHILRYCIDCCLSRGYATYRTEKGERVLTILDVKE